MIDPLLEAVRLVFSWPVFGWLVAGILLGIIFGATPGIGSTLGMALVLPFTIVLDGLSAFVVLIGIYHGATYGGSITAILINVPGTAASAASTFDGYPMSRQGLAKNALAISATASMIGGLLTASVLILVSPIITGFLLRFGSPENFMMTLLGIAMISVISKGSVVKGYVAGTFGLLAMTVGIAPMAPVQRYTFGSLALFDGLSFIAILIGLFAVSEMLILAIKPGGIADADAEITGSLGDGIGSVFKKPLLTAKSSILGLLVGAIPGAGASVSNFFAYSEALRSSKDPDAFGNGSEEGLIAAESANNGTVGGSMLPTIAFGIPGSTATAVLLGGLIMHGLRPGPSMFTSELHITYSMLFALFVGSLLIFLLGVTVVIHMAAITQVDSNRLIPIILVFSVLGSLAMRNNWVDVFTIVAIGFLGYFMVKYNYSVIAFTLGAVLAPIAEENFYRSLLLGEGSAMIFLTRPISLFLVLCTLLMLFTPMIDRYRARNTA